MNYRTKATDDFDPSVLLALAPRDPIVVRAELWGGSWVAGHYQGTYTSESGDTESLVEVAHNTQLIGAWRVHPVEAFIPGEYAWYLFGTRSWSGQVMHPLDPDVHDARKRPECKWWALCENTAELVRHGPIGDGRWGNVPICRRCDAHVATLD